MNITVIGAGNTGLAMAAHAAAEGHNVILWNRSPETISEISKTNTIYSKGSVEGTFELRSITTDIKEALVDPDLILVTTPTTAHKSLAEKIAKNIAKETTILLCPGRVYGALEFRAVYDRYNQEHQLTIAETQTSIYTCRKTSQESVDLITIKSNVLFSAIDHHENEAIYRRFPAFLQKHVTPASSMIETSIGSVGLIMHCTPLLLNTGWTENPNYSYKYYIDGISPSIAKLLEKIDTERIEVSKKLGVEVESVRDWLKRVYGIEGETLYDSIQNNEAYATIEAPTTLNHRYVTEDVPNGLVPIESTGKYLGLEMKYTGIIIDLASVLLDTDFRKEGRTLEDVFNGTEELETFMNRSEPN